MIAIYIANYNGAIVLLYPPPRVRVRATVKLSATFFHDESSITIGGYESAIALLWCHHYNLIALFSWAAEETFTACRC